MRFLKMLFVLIVSIMSIIALTVLAMRYMDVMMKPYNALKKLGNKMSATRGRDFFGDTSCCADDGINDF